MKIKRTYRIGGQSSRKSKMIRFYTKIDKVRTQIQYYGGNSADHVFMREHLQHKINIYQMFLNNI